ncbi:transcriptional regulator [Escherichia coli]|uniref:Transcriptional regulator n=1 Tax=Escherichia coli TaxID=562 RepID=A0A377BCC3_ECOLX|nr:transcriptional regulator [Escherichia coli]
MLISLTVWEYGRPVSITIFQTKTDLGLAYCEYKEASLLKLEAALLQLPPGKARLQGYMDAFLKCADSGQMCGIHAMLSDSALFEEPLQKATSRLAQTDLRILTSVLVSGRESGELAFTAEPADVAIIIGSAIKGALMLNRIPPHDACSRTMERAYSATLPPVKPRLWLPRFNRGSQHSKKSPLTTPVFRGPQKTLRLSLRLISSYPLPIYLLVGRININNTTTPIKQTCRGHHHESTYQRRYRCLHP